jgi:hypothetical protein
LKSSQKSNGRTHTQSSQIAFRSSGFERLVRAARNRNSTRDKPNWLRFGGAHGFDIDLFAQRRPQQPGFIDDEGVDVGAARLQRLTAGEGGQMLVRSAPHAAAALIGLVIWTRGGRSLTASPRISMVPVITVRMLLKSCAMPPVSWPTASIFWACRSWDSVASTR